MNKVWLIYLIFIPMIKALPPISYLKEERSMQLLSNSFKQNEQIPRKFTCEGENISPSLRWDNAPKNTKSFVLICSDPDAPNKTWIHWILFNIPSKTNALIEEFKPTDLIGQGLNDFGKTNYGGPCPPQGHGDHRYIFTLYALDTVLSLPQGTTYIKLQEAMRDHILEKTELLGIYARE